MRDAATGVELGRATRFAGRRSERLPIIKCIFYVQKYKRDRNIAESYHRIETKVAAEGENGTERTMRRREKKRREEKRRER